MALYNSLSADRRQVDQGDTWTFTVEPAVTITNTETETTSGGHVVVYDKTTTLQWHGTVRLAKQYRYVGLTKTAAESAAAQITAAYTVQQDKWGVALDTTDGIYKYAVVGQAVSCYASVTPRHVAGSMWEVEVQVDAKADIYTDEAAPDAAAMKALLASVASFPEGV